MKKITKLPGMLLLMAATSVPIVAQTGKSAKDLALKANQITAGQKVVFKGISVTNSQWINWGSTSTEQLTADNVFVTEAADGGLILKRESDNKYIGRGAGNADNSVYNITMVDNSSEATVFTASTPNLDGTTVTGTHEVKLPDWIGSDEGYQVRFSSSDSYFLNVQTGGTGLPKQANGKGSWSVSMVYDASQPLSSIAIKCVDENGNVVKNDFDLVRTNTEYTFSAPTVSGYKFTGQTEFNDASTQETTTTISDNATITYHYEFSPFEFSTLSEDGTTFENVTWYRIGIHSTEANRRYWIYDATNSNLNITTKDNFDMYSDNQLFCFVGTKDNLKIYNKAAGTSVWATYDGNNNQVSMTNSEDESGTWSWVLSTASTGNICFKTNVAGVTNCYINNYNMEAVKYWQNPDAGSTCYFNKFDFNTEVDNYKTTLDNKLASVESIIGLVDGPASLEAWKAPIDAFKADPSKENYDAVQTALSQVVTIEPGQYYRAINADYATRETPNYLSFTADVNGQLQPVEGESTTAFNDPQTLFQIVKNEDNSYSMKLQGALIGNTQTQSKPVYLTGYGADQGTYSAGTYNLEKKATACYLLRCTNPVATGDGGNKVCITMLDTDGVFSVSTWGDGVKYSQWYIQPAKDINVDITAAGYATVNYPFAVQVPEEVTAYTGKADAENGVFTLSEIEGGIIPANTPVVLQAAAGTHTLTILTDNNDQALESGLKGTLLSETIEGSTNAYILGKKENSEAGFYQMDGTDRTLAANKAYLVLPQEASAVRSIIFSDGTTTGIESTVAEGTEAEEYYDLQGRRVMNPTKGIYVTKSGKKVLFNK